MKIILPIALALGLVLPFPAPHELEDGFVERTFAVVIRDNIATAKYSIGVNETTLKEIIAQWQKPEATDLTAKIEPTRNQTSSAKTDVQPKAAISAPSDSAKSPQSLQLNSEQSEQEGRVGGSSTKFVELAAQATIQSAAAKSEDSSPDSLPPTGYSTNAAAEENTDSPDSEHPMNAISKELLASLQKLGPSHIAQQILVTCDGQPLQIKNVSAGPAPRHPFNLTVQFEFEIPELKSESAKLKIEDHNFRRHAGAIRTALKTRGNTMLVKSDAAPIIVRAQRHQLAGLPEKEASKKTSISAEIVILSK